MANECSVCGGQVYSSKFTDGVIYCSNHFLDYLEIDRELKTIFNARDKEYKIKIEHISDACTHLEIERIKAIILKIEKMNAEEKKQFSHEFDSDVNRGIAILKRFIAPS